MHMELEVPTIGLLQTFNTIEVIPKNSRELKKIVVQHPGRRHPPKKAVLTFPWNFGWWNLLVKGLYRMEPSVGVPSNIGPGTPAFILLDSCYHHLHCHTLIGMPNDCED